MGYQIIIDTNKCRNTGMDNFLGNKEELQKFIEDSCEIILPEIVLSELKQQKKIEYIEELNNFINNKFFNNEDANFKKIKLEEFDNIIEKKIQDEQGKYYSTIYEITRVGEFYKEMTQKAVLKEAPFDTKSDKGFKDSIVAWSVKEVVDKYNRTVFLLTKDNRLSQYFVDEDKVKIIESYSDYKKIRLQVENKDLIDNITIIRKLNIEQEDIIKGWYSLNNDYYMVLYSGGCARFDIITKDIIDGIQENPNKIIDELITSFNYANTHDKISYIKKLNIIEYISREKLLELFDGFTKNSQLYEISHDEDVWDFFSILYKKYKKFMNDDLEKNFLNSMRAEISESGEVYKIERYF